MNLQSCALSGVLFESHFALFGQTERIYLIKQDIDFHLSLFKQ